MKKGFYLKLALTGISKNRKMYFPYILTCVGMVMMFYIICFLSRDPWLASLRGGDTLQLMLGMGTWITGIFAVIFLFYTNSFLIRRRKKEFGLYNMLGMNKARILFWECLVIAGIALAAGMAAGILLSKLGELILSNILDGAVSFSFLVDPKSLALTAALFGVIFLLILLNGLRQVHFANPRELLESDRVGEKPPKANWVLAVLGVLMLGFAYYLTLTIQDPLVAMVVFFGAVALVILGTYLVFISGSVAFLKLLQKNKRYHHGAGDDLRHSVPVCRSGEESSQHVSQGPYRGDLFPGSKRGKYSAGSRGRNPGEPWDCRQKPAAVSLPGLRSHAEGK